MKKVNTEIIAPSIRKLLSFATAQHKVDLEYKKYVTSLNRTLYSFDIQGEIVGCIGIEQISLMECKIKHIAVSADQRGQGIGSKMLDSISDKYSLISAETDHEAVAFYRNYGFMITSLGEKYPGVERFLCEYKKPIIIT